jgi:hypothetical protein
MSDFEKMEEDYVNEHSSGSYNKQEYAKKMHEKELEEMSQVRKGAWKDNIVGHGFNFLAYCKEYQE